MKGMAVLPAILLALTSTLAGAQSKFTPIQPPPAARGNAPAGELKIGQGRFFSFAMPPGWRIGEDGQFALTQVSPNGDAMTVMVGNAGMPLNYPPAQYVFDKLSAMRPSNIRIGAPQPARPGQGFSQAVEYPIAFVGQQGVPWSGTAKVSIAPAYDTMTMAMTAAMSHDKVWPAYRSWLPSVSSQVSALNGGAFGARGVMAQNLKNSEDYGRAQQAYRDWSQKNWQGVVDQRNASNDKQAFERRQNLGTGETYTNPYGNPNVDLPRTHSYYWTDRQGRIVGTDDPSANPNDGSTGEWRRMERAKH